MSSPEDNAIVQKTCREFVDDFYGRLNTYGAVRYVADMFAERARFHSLDVPDNKSTVGRTDAVSALREFCRTHGGRGGVVNDEQRRRIVVLSVSAFVDYDYDDDDNKNGRRQNDRRYEMIVHAEWKSPTKTGTTCTAAPTPFVQTFLVGRRLAPDGGTSPSRHLEILKTVVKLTPTIPSDDLKPPTITTTETDLRPTTVTKAVADLRLTYSNSNNSKEDNKFVNTPEAQLKNKRNSSTKKMISRGQEVKLSHSTPVTTVPSRPVTAVFSQTPSTVSPWPTHGGKQAKRLWRSEGEMSSARVHYLEHLEREAYERRVETFLKSDYSQSFRLCVYDLDASFTVKDLYTVFGRYGTVLWARIVPAKNKSRVNATSSGQEVGLEGHVCMECTDAAQRILDEHQAHKLLIRGVHLPVKLFVEE